MIVFRNKNEITNHRFPSFIMKHPNPTSEYILNGGIPELSLIHWCGQFLSKDTNFVDVGAHMGTYTIFLANKAKHVYSFEAQKMTYYQLCGGIAVNNLENVDAHHIALGSSDGEGILTIVSPDGGGSTLLHHEQLPGNQKPICHENVKIRSLDSYNIEDIGLIKIDVEGNELNVIKGALNTLLRSNYPPILFEAWPDECYRESKQQLFDYIKELGYKIISIRGYNQMFLGCEHSLRK